MKSLYEGRLIFASNMRRGGELKDLKLIVELTASSGLVD